MIHQRIFVSNNIVEVTSTPDRCHCAIITLANAKSKIVMYFSFVSPLTKGPAKKQSRNGKYFIIITNILVYVRDGLGGIKPWPPAPPGYAFVAHFIIKLSSFNVYRNSLNCISSVTGVKYLHFLRKMNGHIL